MKFGRFLVASALFVVLLMACYVGHMLFLRVNVVFYAAILDGVAAAFATFIFLLVLPPFAVFNAFEKCMMALVWLLAAYAFAISVPTVLDRSLSFYILEKIQQRGGGIQLSQFEAVFTKEYVKEHRLVDVRLTEQQESGTIVIENGCVKLTQRGRELASFSRWFRMNLLPKQRLLMGQYSDDLTDPFRNSQQAADYACR